MRLIAEFPEQQVANPCYGEALSCRPSDLTVAYYKNT